MEILFITKPVTLIREAKTIKIVEDDDTSFKKRVPINLIKSVYIFGNANLSASARNLLLEYGRDIYFFSHKGEFRGVLHNAKLKSNYKNRLIQFTHINNLEVAKLIVEAKIDEIEKFLKTSLNRYKQKLKEAKKLNEILGIEGQVSSYMFSKIKELLKEVDIEFKKREYNPPTDIVNSALSFVYSLHYAFLHTIVIERGFDPYIGFLHKKRGTHMAFVSDLMEGYRVVLSAFVVTLFRKKLITKDDFEDIYFTYEGRKKFLRFYIEFLEKIDNEWFIKYLEEKLYALG